MSRLIKKYPHVWLGVALIVILPIIALSSSSNPPLARTGAPGENNCGSCHSGITGTGRIVVSAAGGATYTPGVKQRLTVTISDPAASAWGYEMSAVQAAATSTGAGTFTAIDAFSSVRTGTGTNSSKSYAAQLNDLAGTTGSATYQIDWTPPATNVGNITLYLSGVGADNTGDETGDSVYVSSLTLSPAVAAASLTLSPSTLTFAYQTGGSTPAAQNVAVASSGTALNFTVASSATWLTATPASGSTPGTLSVAVNPTGLAAGTYNGTITVTASSAANSPQTVAVTLNVTAPVPNLTVSPATLTFAYQTGGSTPAAQNVSVASSGGALSYTVASSATWLTATPASGSTPGTLSVAVNPTGLAAGTYNGTITVTASSAANSPRTVAVTLAITNPGTGSLSAFPRTLSFNSGHESEDGRSRSSRRLRVTSNPGALQFTAAALGGSWLSVSAAGGTTPATLAVTASPVGLARGSYTGQIQLSAPGAGSISVPVTLTVAGEGGGEDSSFRTTTYTYDPTNTGAVAATWVYGAGVPATDASDPTNQGLMLSNNAPAASKARAGVILDGVANTALIVLGFDMRQGSLCSTRGPRFIVVTSDDVAHAVGGCKAANSQPAPAPGWTRFVFTPAQASPAIAPGSTVKSIALMLDDGPDAAGGIVVLDNINLNGTLIGHE